MAEFGTIILHWVWKEKPLVHLIFGNRKFANLTENYPEFIASAMKVQWSWLCGARTLYSYNSEVLPPFMSEALSVMDCANGISNPMLEFIRPLEYWMDPSSSSTCEFSVYWNGSILVDIFIIFWVIVSSLKGIFHQSMCFVRSTWLPTKTAVHYPLCDEWYENFSISLDLNCVRRIKFCVRRAKLRC